MRPVALLAAALALTLFACMQPRPTAARVAPVVASAPTVAAGPAPGSELQRAGDEIVACGRLFHTGAPVVLWTDPGGYDAYRVSNRFSPESRPSRPEAGCDTPNRYGTRALDRLDPATRARVEDRGWDLDALAETVDQFVIHYDVCGVSRQCFRILHDVRGLSVHFMLDVDGTIYQTLDLKERARHAGAANDRSVGVEIAQIGAYTEDERAVLDAWYAADDQGDVRIRLPRHLGDPKLRVADFVARPARREPVAGSIHGRRLLQYDFTDEQYRSLAKLTATLCTVLPRIRAEAPRGEGGAVLPTVLDEQQLRAFGGLVGHYHLTTNKIDPGPAFDWERLLAAVREINQP